MERFVRLNNHNSDNFRELIIAECFEIHSSFKNPNLQTDVNTENMYLKCNHRMNFKSLAF